MKHDPEPRPPTPMPELPEGTAFAIGLVLAGQRVKPGGYWSTVVRSEKGDG